MYVDGIILLVIYAMAASGLLISLYLYFEVKELKRQLRRKTVENRINQLIPKVYSKTNDPWRK